MVSPMDSNSRWVELTQQLRTQQAPMMTNKTINDIYQFIENKENVDPLSHQSLKVLNNTINSRIKDLKKEGNQRNGQLVLTLGALSRKIESIIASKDTPMNISDTTTGGDYSRKRWKVEESKEVTDIKKVKH